MPAPKEGKSVPRSWFAYIVIDPQDMVNLRGAITNYRTYIFRPKPEPSAQAYARTYRAHMREAFWRQHHVLTLALSLLCLGFGIYTFVSFCQHLFTGHFWSFTGILNLVGSLVLWIAHRHFTCTFVDVVVQAHAAAHKEMKKVQADNAKKNAKKNARRNAARTQASNPRPADTESASGSGEATPEQTADARRRAAMAAAKAKAAERRKNRPQP